MKTMDMYLIGGQSNAVGYSPMNDFAEKTDQIFEGFWYGGQTDILLPSAAVPTFTSRI